MLSTEETLPEEVRRILYRYDCDCVPLFVNQLDAYQAYKNFCYIWGVKSSPSQQSFQSMFNKLLLWIEAQPFPQTPARHSLRISRRRTRALTVLQVQLS